MSTLNLKVGEKIFPVKKSVLSNRLGLFQETPSLLESEEYEVQTKVSLSVFSAFVYLLEGDRVGLHEATVESFRLLADEFGFEELSSACTSFSASSGISEGESSGTETLRSLRPRVKLMYNNCLHTYEVLTSLSEINKFGLFLSGAKEEDIVIDGVNERDRVVDKAVATVYFNTVASLPDDNAKEPVLALILWQTHDWLHLYSIDTVIYCFRLLNIIAATGFDKARLLILSQCDPGRPDDFVPLPTADWSVIGTGIRILRQEKNGKTNEARELLRKLRATGWYNSNPMVESGVWSLEPYSMLTGT
jgi:hypothetical protein